MKKLLYLNLIIIFFLNFIFGMTGKVTYIEGSVYINYSPADLNQVVKKDDLITTHEGRVEIELSDGNVIRIGENSRIYISELHKKKRKKITVKVFLGKLWAKVKKIVKEKDEFTVKFRKGTAGVRGTVYRVNQYSDDSAEIYVYEGSIKVKGEKPVSDKDKKDKTGKKTKSELNRNEKHEVEGPKEIKGPEEVTLKEWVKIVKKMNKIYISSRGKPDEPEEFNIEAERKKSWVNWNLKRDKEKKK